MVRTSMDVDIYTVSIHGWDNNEYRTPSCLPSAVYHALPAQIPISSCLPDRPQTQEDDVSHLCPRESIVMAAPREKNSYHPQAPAREEEAEHVFLDGRDQQQIKAQDLPYPNHGLHLQSWLFC